MQRGLTEILAGGKFVVAEVAEKLEAEPERASLPNIMKAQPKPLAQKKPEEYGVDITPRLTTVTVSEPPVRQAGVKVADVDELVAKLKALGVAA